MWTHGDGTSVRGPESQEGACESMKGPIALAIDVLFLFFSYIFGYFQLFIVYLEKIIMKNSLRLLNSGC